MPRLPFGVQDPDPGLSSGKKRNRSIDDDLFVEPPPVSTPSVSGLASRQSFRPSAPAVTVPRPSAPFASPSLFSHDFDNQQASRAAAAAPAGPRLSARSLEITDGRKPPLRPGDDLPHSFALPVPIRAESPHATSPSSSFVATSPPGIRAPPAAVLALLQVCPPWALVVPAPSGSGGLVSLSSGKSGAPMSQSTVSASLGTRTWLPGATLTTAARIANSLGACLHAYAIRCGTASASEQSSQPGTFGSLPAATMSLVARGSRRRGQQHAAGSTSGWPLGPPVGASAGVSVRPSELEDLAALPIPEPQENPVPVPQRWAVATTKALCRLAGALYKATHPLSLPVSSPHVAAASCHGSMAAGSDSSSPSCASVHPLPERMALASAMLGHFSAFADTAVALLVAPKGKAAAQRDMHDASCKYRYNTCTSTHEWLRRRIHRKSAAFLRPHRTEKATERPTDELHVNLYAAAERPTDELHVNLYAAASIVAQVMSDDVYDRVHTVLPDASLVDITDFWESQLSNAIASSAVLETHTEWVPIALSTGVLSDPNLAPKAGSHDSDVVDYEILQNVVAFFDGCVDTIVQLLGAQHASRKKVPTISIPGKYLFGELLRGVPADVSFVLGMAVSLAVDLTQAFLAFAESTFSKRKTRDGTKANKELTEIPKWHLDAYPVRLTSHDAAHMATCLVALICEHLGCVPVVAPELAMCPPASHPVSASETWSIGGETSALVATVFSMLDPSNTFNVQRFRQVSACLLVNSPPVKLLANQSSQCSGVGGPASVRLLAHSNLWRLLQKQM